MISLSFSLASRNTREEECRLNNETEILTRSSCVDLGNDRKNEKDEYAIEPGLLGFVNSCYQLGSIFAVPIAPWFAHRFGRRWSIMLGSLIMVVGALLQGFAQHGKERRINPSFLYGKAAWLT